MNKLKFAVAVAIASISTGPAFADTGTTAQTVETQRDVNQQQRIENGLDSGQLSSHEAGRLEREESHVDQMESHAAADGSVSKAEAARINSAQNAVSKTIYSQKHDAQARLVGRPFAASRFAASPSSPAASPARTSSGAPPICSRRSASPTRRMRS